MLSVLRDFGLDDFYLELSTRDDSKPDKFVGSDEDWAAATAVLEQVATESGLDSCPIRAAPRSTAPRCRSRPMDAIGRTWQMGTVQYDFNQPSPDRFNLTYVAPTARASSR